MADSEVRQKFEAWARLQGDSISRTSRYGEHRPYDSTFTEWEWRSWLAGFEAGMRAGEIAMKEKAAQLANSCAEILPPEHRVGATWIGDKIRALPLSGAEESKKEKA